ncbi:unnamed protein product [Darwinula stevensoni]|uniref:Uncharacterized protein n=1 Tax=Darwinula stevensoni TaxID=69355 RepID=A0A7R9AET0_9CRUS|nr:unnamed protein product [Darwinula stevensoni]CAG0902615.1 unnamed protein product [Darwinula stevensoni]
MGNIDSVPILSQYKSLVQVITGDAEGARETQENFIHTNPEFVNGLQEFVEGTLDHVDRVIYHILGERERENTDRKDDDGNHGIPDDGIPIPIPEKIFKDDDFGIAFQLENSALTGMVATKIQIKVDSPAETTERCRRSVAEDESLLFSPTLPDVPAWVQEKLPTSLIEGFAAGEAAWTNQTTADAVATTQTINAVLTIFLMLKLMMTGHQRSKPYYDEICRGHSQVDRCEQLLFESLNKYGDVGVVTVDGEEEEILEDSLGGLMYGMREMERSSLVGQGLMASLCDNDKSCMEQLRDGLLDAAAAFKKHLRLGRLYRRVKRGCLSRGIILPQENLAEMFKEHHTMPKNDFENAIKHIDTAIHEGVLPNPEKGITHSTIIDRDDLPNLRAKESPVPDFPGQFDAEVRYILHDIPKKSAVSKIGTVRYVRDLNTGEIVHMIGPQP